MHGIFLKWFWLFKLSNMHCSVWIHFITFHTLRWSKFVFEFICPHWLIDFLNRAFDIVRVINQRILLIKHLKSVMTSLVSNHFLWFIQLNQLVRYLWNVRQRLFKYVYFWFLGLYGIATIRSFLRDGLTRSLGRGIKVPCIYLATLTC